MSVQIDPFAGDRHGLARAAWHRALAHHPALPDAVETAALKREQLAAAQTYRRGDADGWPRDGRLERCFPASLMVALGGSSNREFLESLPGVRDPSTLAWLGLVCIEGGRPWRRPVPRDVRERLGAIERHAKALSELLGELPGWHLRRVLPVTDLVPLTEDSGADALHWRAAMQSLALHSRTYLEALPAVSAGRQESPAREILAMLVEFWVGATGARPTVHLPDVDEGGHPSPFAAFAHGFVGHLAAVLWAADEHRDASFVSELEARGLDSPPSERLLRLVCREVTQSRNRKAN